MDATRRKNKYLGRPGPSNISRNDIENYLFRVYFGPGDDLVNACINRAYLDFNRTLYGIGKIESADDIKIKATDLLRSQLQELRLLVFKPITLDMFDEWHRKTCEMLISYYDQNGFHFFVGQAQKWVNMTLKYIFTFGETRIPGFEKTIPFCHAPIDNILLKNLQKKGFPSLEQAWSKFDDYDEYIKRQKWIREKFHNSPLIIEFRLWLEKEIET